MNQNWTKGLIWCKTDVLYNAVVMALLHNVNCVMQRVSATGIFNCVVMLNLMNRICDLLEVIVSLLQAILGYITEEMNKIPEEPADTPAELDRMLEINEVLDKLGISESKYYRLVRDGKLRPRKLGKRHYYYLSDLHEQLEESRQKGRI
ncbi:MULTISPECIES: helix-turn-helix transcriptional regulator [Sphingobacterium]|uniref:helix-turn-helix transcriptional regulator n=1 Tax=Sphingobacterium TaxID=28453 RepID=UPI00257CF3E4|nr:MULTISPECIES: helix-turn-helix domain-containing protein [Sphingobacterium]